MIESSTRPTAGVYRRCGCKDPATGRRWAGRCPRLADPSHGSWYFAVQATDPRGRRFRLRRGGYDSAAAASVARAMVLDRDVHERFGEIATVRDWMYSWLASIESTVRATTWQSYRSQVTEYPSPWNRTDPAAGPHRRPDPGVVRCVGYPAEPVRAAVVAGDVAADPGDVAPLSEHRGPRTGLAA